MTEQHPITPPPELVQEWCLLPLSQDEVLVIAAHWGADQELKACCEWLEDPDLNVDTYKLCAARRPKPPISKEQALAQLTQLVADLDRAGMRKQAATLEGPIRRALEALPDA
jgi:hypothetical protein